MIICDCAITFSNSATESRISSAFKFLNTFVITFAPARSNAHFYCRTHSLSTGNTGMKTVGCPILCVQIWISLVQCSPFSITAFSDAGCTSMFCIFCFSSETVGNTLFQSSFPCSHCFIQTKLHLSIGDCVVCCASSKECIRNRKFFKSFCQLSDQIPECRCKQFTLINLFSQFYTMPFPNAILTYRCCNSVSVQRIGRNNLATVDIFCKFCILIF